MNDIALLLKGLAYQSWLYLTFRGSWKGMPDSTGLCITLGIISVAIAVVVAYIEYGLAAALPLPAIWLTAVWMLTTEQGLFKPNKRLMSAVFLLSIPSLGVMIAVGKGHIELEIVVGMYISAVTLSMIGRE